MSDKINNDEDKPSMISKSRCNCDDKIGLTTDNSGPRADDNDRESADAVTPDQTEVKVMERPLRGIRTKGAG